LLLPLQNRVIYLVLREEEQGLDYNGHDIKFYNDYNSATLTKDDCIQGRTFLIWLPLNFFLLIIVSFRYFVWLFWLPIFTSKFKNWSKKYYVHTWRPPQDCKQIEACARWMYIGKSKNIFLRYYFKGIV
jgi:hypothetical protein